ncbi:hypothetical protein JCM9534A_58220 [Catenuloplanes indicus JCM 9534]
MRLWEWRRTERESVAEWHRRAFPYRRESLSTAAPAACPVNGETRPWPRPATFVATRPSAPADRLRRGGRSGAAAEPEASAWSARSAHPRRDNAGSGMIALLIVEVSPGGPGTAP